MGGDVLRLAEQRADCVENRGRKHQAPCQGLRGINPSDGAGAPPGQEAVPRSNNALLIPCPEYIMKEGVFRKKKGEVFQYLGASCPQFVMRVHFSVLK